MSSATAPRKQAARLPRPAARYRKGQAPKGCGEAASESDEDDEEQQNGELEAGDVLIQDFDEDEDEDGGGLEVRREVVGKLQGKGMNVALRDVNISKEGRVVVAGKAEVGKTEVEIGALNLVCVLFSWLNCDYALPCPESRHSKRPPRAPCLRHREDEHRRGLHDWCVPALYPDPHTRHAPLRCARRSSSQIFLRSMSHRVVVAYSNSVGPATAVHRSTTPIFCASIWFKQPAQPPTLGGDKSHGLISHRPTLCPSTESSRTPLNPFATTGGLQEWV